MTNILKRMILCLVPLLITACATPTQYDYTAYRQSKPHSILVLPPLNNSPDIQATYSVLSTVSQPLAEAGYYVFPVALVDQTFKENGLLNPGEMHQAPLKKIREIFGADAALYITVTKYGGSYQLLSSDVVVAAQATLVDTRTGQLLWAGMASASDAEGNSNNGGLAGLLVTALVKQVINNVAGDKQSHRIARITSNRLFTPGPNGLLYGPRSPQYEQQQ
ncbi:MAG: DUF799 domain-containing protein [Gallionellaceae bacterium]|nr:DUF799 domain-containing protein [Gallionellaceae bacterium]